MIVPVVFSLAPNTRDLMYEWTFLKGITFAKQHHSAVIAQEQYFNSDDKIEKYFPWYYDEEYARATGYEIPKHKDFENTLSYKIPKKIEEVFIAQYPSETDAFLATAKSDWPEMEDFLVASLRDAEKRQGEKLEAISSLCDYQFLRNVAKRLDIKVLFFEIGAFRPPLYRQTCYIDFNGLQGNSTLQKQLECFKERTKQLPIFTKSEILALFLSQDQLQYALFNPSSSPQYDCGVVLGYSTLLPLSAHNGVSSIEMVTRAQRIFHDAQYCVRYHPGDPIRAKVDAPEEREGNTADFILKCKRILCASSNMSYEAMLYNRSAYDIGWSQYGCMVNHSLENMKDKIASDEELSFVAFGFYAPYELLMNMDYLRYRLSEPDISELYEYHLNYYLNCLSIDPAVLDLTGEERLHAILRARGYVGACDGLDYSNQDIWLQCDHSVKQDIEILRLKEKLFYQQNLYARLQAQNVQYEQQLDDLQKVLEQMHVAATQQHATTVQQEEEIIKLHKSLQEILDSTSYRITKPLRQLMKIIKR